MKQEYEGWNKLKRAQLEASRRDFKLLSMKEGETIEEYFVRTLAIVNKMKRHGENVTQTMVVEKMLRSLTPRFNYGVCSIEESNDVTTLFIDGL